MDENQNPPWPPAPEPYAGQGTTLPGGDTGAAWPSQADGAGGAPFVISPAPGQQPYMGPYGGDATNPSWYGQPAYTPIAPTASQPLGSFPPPPAPPMPSAPMAPQPVAPYPPMPSQPLGGYAGAPPYAPSGPLGYAPSQPLGGYPLQTGYPQNGYGQTGYLPPAPGYGYPQPPMVYVQQPRGSNGSAVAVEAILAFFGIYGVGWLMAGETTVGVVLLLASFFWWGLAIVVTAATVGFGLFCIAPINIGCVILSAALLSNHTRR